MANEITIGASLRLINGDLKETKGTNGYRTVQATGDAIGGTQIIGTTEEVIAYGDASTPGWAWFQNLDDTNYVEIGVKPASTFYPVIKLLAEDPPVLLKIADSVALYAKANTAEIKLNKLILEL